MTFLTREQELLNQLGFFWTDVFEDDAFIQGYVRAMQGQMDNLDGYVANLVKYLSRYDIPLAEESALRLFAFPESLRDTFAAHYGDGLYNYGDNVAYGDLQPAPPTATRYPVPPGYTCEFFIAGNNNTVLQAGVDFYFENDTVVFAVDPLNRDEVNKLTFTTDGEPEFVAFMWGMEVRYALPEFSSYFGTLAGVSGPASRATKDAINLAWNMRMEGVTAQHLVKMLSILTDMDAVETAGVVQRVTTEGDRAVVVTDTGIYTAPLDYTPLVTEYDQVSPGDIIFDAFEIYSPEQIPYTEDIPGFVGNSGYVRGVTHGILFPNEVVPVTTSLHPDYRAVYIDSDTYLVLDRDNNVVDSIVDETEASDVILNSPVNYHSFFVGGSPADVRRFMDKLNTAPAGGTSFFAQLSEANGHLPIAVNPFELFRPPNTTFIKIKVPVVDYGLAAALFSVARRTWPAGMSFVVLFETTVLEDVITSSSVDEEVELFYVLSTDDDVTGPVRDHILASSIT